MVIGYLNLERKVYFLTFIGQKHEAVSLPITERLQKHNTSKELNTDMHDETKTD